MGLRLAIAIVATRPNTAVATRAPHLNDRCDFEKVAYKDGIMAWTRTHLPRDALRHPWVLTGAMDAAVERHASVDEQSFVARFGALIAERPASPPMAWADVHHRRWYIRDPPSLSAAIRMRIPQLRPLRDALEEAVPFLAWARAHGFGSIDDDGDDDGGGTLVPVLSAGAAGEKLGTHRHDASYHLQVHGSRMFQLASPAYTMETLMQDDTCSADVELDMGDPCAVRFEPMLRSNTTGQHWNDVAAGAIKTAGVVVLREGDILFLPDDWWHSVCHVSEFSWGLSILDGTRYEGVPYHNFRWEVDGKCQNR